MSTVLSIEPPIRASTRSRCRANQQIIAEAWRETPHQLALQPSANGFTYVSVPARGDGRDDFAHQTSFLLASRTAWTPEYTLIGRVARRIWAVAMRERYGRLRAIPEAQQYHVPTSGRSLHAQEMASTTSHHPPGPVRQLRHANSLHTTPTTRRSPRPPTSRCRRASPIQFVITGNGGSRRTRNPLRAASSSTSHRPRRKAVLAEFERLSSAAACSGPWRRLTSGPDPGRLDALREKKHGRTLPIVG